jgi:hypothetical protein
LQEAVKAELAGKAQRELAAQQEQLKEQVEVQAQTVAATAAEAIAKRNQTYTAYLRYPKPRLLSPNAPSPSTPSPRL